MNFGTETTGSFNPLTQRMLADAVDQVLKNGKCFTSHDRDKGWLSDARLDKFKAYAKRNSGKMVGASLKVLAAGLLAGPIGVAAAVGGAIFMPVARFAWRSYRKSSAQSSINAHGHKVFTDVTVVRTDKNGNQRIDTDKVVNDSFAEIMEDVGYLCRHGEMTKALNACIDLHKDYDVFHQRYGSDPAVLPNITDCNQAWTFLEHGMRVGYRFEGVRGVFHLLDDLNNFIVSEKSKIDAEFESTRSGFILRFATLTKGGNGMTVMNDAANSSDVFNHSYFTRKDYSAWIKVHIGQAVHINLATQQQAPASASVNAGSQAAQTGAGTLVKGVLVGGGIKGATTAYTATAAAIAKENANDAIVKSFAAQSGGIASNTLSSAAAGGINAGIGIVVDIAVESLTRYLQMRELKALLKKKEQHDADNVREYELHKKFTDGDLEVLRKNAKDLNEKLIEKMDHLLKAHEKYKAIQSGGGTAEEMAKAFLRRQKLSGQVDALYGAYQLFIFFFFGRANYIDETAEIMVKKFLSPLNNLIVTPPREPCEGLCCYHNAKDMLGYVNALGLLKTDKETTGLEEGAYVASLIRQWNNQPFKPVPGSNAGLADKFL
jgi:hypothetical protein